MSTMQRIFVVLMILAAVGAGAWVVRERGVRRVDGMVPVRRGKIVATVEATGRVEPVRQVRLSLRTGGTVQSVLVHQGDLVTPGQVLVKLDSQGAMRRVREAELNLELRRQELEATKAGPSPSAVEAAQANLRQATIALQAAQAQYDAVAQQRDPSTSPEAIGLEQAKAAYRRAKADLQQTVEGPGPEEISRLEKLVEVAQVNLEDAKAQLDATQLTAPFTGTVIDLQVHPGENASPGVPIVTLADLNVFQIRANIDEIDVASVATGQAVDIRLDAFPGKTLAGKIVHVAPAANTERGATTYQATVELPETELALKPGMAASLKITTRTQTGVLLVPSRAVQPIGRKKVVRVVQSGQVQEVEVVTGLSDGTQTEIVAGLQEGQTVLMP